MFLTNNVPTQGTLGPGVCSGLKAKYNNKVACQGVGAGYSGNIQDALLPKGTTDAAIAAGLGMINLAFWKCPKTQIVFGGYRSVLLNFHAVLSPMLYHVF